MDFVHDQLATGRKIRVLTVVDTFTRFSPAIKPRSASGLLMWLIEVVPENWTGG